jgi:hypothetical protein
VLGRKTILYAKIFMKNGRTVESTVATWKSARNPVLKERIVYLESYALERRVHVRIWIIMNAICRKAAYGTILLQPSRNRIRAVDRLRRRTEIVIKISGLTTNRKRACRTTAVVLHVATETAWQD